MCELVMGVVVGWMGGLVNVVLGSVVVVGSRVVGGSVGCVGCAGAGLPLLLEVLLLLSLPLEVLLLLPLLPLLLLLLLLLPVLLVLLTTLSALLTLHFLSAAGW